jgi:FlaA1/EpsC-like NDP-sugar epimerase
MKKLLYRLLAKYEKTSTPQIYVFFMDVMIAMCVYGFTILLVYWRRESDFNTVSFFSGMTTAVVVSAIVFLLSNSYCGIIRHSGLGDILLLFHASIYILLILFALRIFSRNVVNIDPWVPTFRQSIIYVLALFCVLSFSRIIIKQFYNMVFCSRDYTTRVIIYGAGMAGVLAKNALVNETNTNSQYVIKAFVDDDPSKKRKTIDNVRVLAPDKALTPTFIEENNIDQLIIALPSASDDVQHEIAQRGLELGLMVKTVPHIRDWINDSLTENQIKEVRIEDLLGRPEIEISLDKIRKEFGGKVVMVTGAAGSIGSELCRQLATFKVKELILFDNAETPMHNLRLELEEKFPGLQFIPIIGDVRQEPRLDFAFRTYRPEAVFHAAAYKHVPLMEENPCEAVQVNVIGSRLVADKCIWYGTEKMVMISTDKAVNPTNVMGCSKRLAEIYIQSLGLAIASGSDAIPHTLDGSAPRTRFVTTRFGNVLGSNGSVIPRFRAQIAAGGPVTVTHPDINRFFMSIPEACRLVMEAATLTTGNQIFVFDMGKSVKIADMARNMIRLSGLTPDKDIQIVYTGLRPGEKLYEEVLSNDENTLPTTHELIRIAKVREYDYTQIANITEELRRLSDAVDIPSTIRLMKTTVPEFISNNSVYEQYDKK